MGLESLEKRVLLSADLSVSKTADVSSPVQGQMIDYTITVQNVGDATATSSTLSDTLPAGLIPISASTDTGSVSMSGGAVTGNLGDISAGATATIHIMATPESGTTGAVTNNVSVSSPDDSNTGNNTAAVAVDVSAPTAAPNLQVGVSGLPGTMTVGQQANVTFTVTNNSGANSASNVQLSGMLPNGVQILAASTSGSGTLTENNGVLTGNLGTLAPGASTTVTLTELATTSGTVNETATATTTSGDSNTANNTASATTDISAAAGAAADLSVTKTASPSSSLTLGQTETYTINVSNSSAAGTGTATGAMVTDTLPSGFSVLSAASSTGSVNVSGGILTANLGDLASGDSATIIVIGLPTITGTLTNTAAASTTAGDTDISNNSATVTTAVNAPGSGAVDLAVSKTGSPDPVTVGQNLTYTVTVTNNSGTNAAANTMLTDALPAGAAYVSASSSQGSVSQSGGIVTADLGSLAAGASATVTITVMPGSAGTLSNTADASTSSGDTNLENNSATATTTVTAAGQGAVDLSVSKTDSPDPVTAGNNLTYTVTVTNNSGANAAANTMLTDALPAGAAYVSANSSQGSVSQSGGIVTADLGSLAAGASATVTITVTPSTPGTLTNTAFASTSSGDSDLSNNSATATTTVNAAGAADLAVTKTASPDPDTVGQNLVYTITVANNSGTNAAANSVLTDTLPSGVTYVSASSTLGSVSLSDGTVTASLGTLAPGASATVIITVTPDSAGTISNTASATTTSGDSNPNNNSATTTTTINAASASADLAVTKTASPSPDTVGQNLTYTITVANNSSTNAAADSVLTDTLPSGVTYVSASSTLGSVSQSGGIVTASLGTLAPGASATVIITVTPNSAGTITNTASATTSSGDSNLSNNTSSVTTTITSSGGGIAAGCYLTGQPGDGTDATFISNLYRELLGRDPDPAGKTFWINFLNRDGHGNQLNNPRRNQMIKFFRASQEYREHLVNCMYENFLNRSADAGGLHFFANQLAHGTDEETVLSEIVGSQEYYLHNGNMNTGFADALYRDLLGRTPDSAGEQYWANRAGKPGLSRDQVIRDMLNTTEAHHDLLNNPSGSALAQVTGGGWENLYFQGNLNGAHDVFFDKLQGHTPWDDVMGDMLETNHYYDSSKSI